MQRPNRIEASGADVEQAIKAGLARLGLSREEVEIEVLSEGSHGLLGFRARPAIVRLTPRPATAPAARPEPTAPARPEPVAPPRPAPAAPARSEPAPPAQPERATPPPVARPAARPVESPAPAPILEPPRRAPVQPAPQPPVSEPETVIPAARPGLPLEQIERVSRDTLAELLERMQIKAQVQSRWSSPADEEDHGQMLVLDVTGEDLGILIGRRGETLEALQYVTRLIVSRELQQRSNLIVDVEGYKARREQYLRRLATRTAEQVVSRRRLVALEPMPPNERRIIHLTLRDHPQVMTESIGEGENRKVTVFLREGQK